MLRFFSGLHMLYPPLRPTNTIFIMSKFQRKPLVSCIFIFETFISDPSLWETTFVFSWKTPYIPTYNIYFFQIFIRWVTWLYWIKCISGNIWNSTEKLAGRVSPDLSAWQYMPPHHVWQNMQLSSSHWRLDIYFGCENSFFIFFFPRSSNFSMADILCPHWAIPTLKANHQNFYDEKHESNSGF